MTDPEKKTDISCNPACGLLEKSLYISLRHYSNVHRGSGQFSYITTCLYEEARKIVLSYLSLGSSYTVIFCSPYSASELVKKIPAKKCKIISGRSLGLNIGINAIAVKNRYLPGGRPSNPGGGTTRLVSPDRISWDGAPGRFEGGTPAIINAVALARALQLMKEYGNNVFHDSTGETNDKTDEHPGLTGYPLFKILSESVIGRNTTVPAVNGLVRYLNLDYAASTPAFSASWEAYRMALYSGNRDNFTGQAMQVISELLNAPSDTYDIVFTSNTTESVNIVAEGTGNAGVLLTFLEHNSNDLPWRGNKRHVARIEVDGEGFVDHGSLEKILSSDKAIRIMALSGASNVTGTCNNIAEISAIAHRHGVLLLVDAAQLVAHREIDMDRSGIDFLVFSGHKAYAPFGTGVLVARKGLIRFSDEKWKAIRSSGEENGAGIAALGKSLDLLKRTGLDLVAKEEQSSLKKTLEGMTEINKVRVFGSVLHSEKINDRLGVISFHIEGIWPDKIAKALMEKGIGIRYGCHCAHILVKHLLNVSPRLQKFQFIIAGLFKNVRFPGVARISLGIGIDEGDITRFLGALRKISHERPAVIDSNMKSKMEEFRRSVTKEVFGIPRADN